MKTFTNILITILILASFLLFPLAIWARNHIEGNAYYYEYEGRAYLLHICEEKENIFVDMLYNGVLASKVIDIDTAKKEGLYIPKVSSDYSYARNRFHGYKDIKRNNEEVVRYMIKNTEGAGQ